LKVDKKKKHFPRPVAQKGGFGDKGMSSERGGSPSKIMEGGEK